MNTKNRVLVFILCFAVILSQEITVFTEQQNKITLSIWSYTYEVPDMILKYYAPNHPGINFVFSVFPTDGGTYESKLDKVLFNSEYADEAPDVFTLESNFVKKYVNSNSTADLNSIGLTQEAYASVYPAIVETGKDNRTGQQKALSWQVSPTVMVYRSSLAEKYLGITSPEEFQNKVCDYISFMNTARELEEASGGNCKIVTGNDYLVAQFSDSITWIQDDELILSQDLLTITEMSRALENGLTYGGGTWSELWFQGMRGENETLTYILPMWGLNYTLMPNCVSGWDVNNPDSENNITNAIENGTYGDWRVVLGPVRANWGGTWIVSSKVKVEMADNQKRMAIKDLMEFLTLDQSFLQQYAKDTGDLVSSPSVVEDMDEQDNNIIDFLGGQNPYTVFDAAAQQTHTSNSTEYDKELMTLWVDYVLTPYSRGQIDVRTGIDNFLNAVASECSELSVVKKPAVLLFSISQSEYTETFSKKEKRYYVLPYETEARMFLDVYSSEENVEAIYTYEGNAIEIEDNIIKTIHTGTATITAWLSSEGEKIKGSEITANIFVIDPKKTISIPRSVTCLETEAFIGIAAECVIVPDTVWVIENNCFAACKNLKAVICLGDPSNIRVSSPFDTESSVLFLSKKGMPLGLSYQDYGLTSFKGFK